MVKENKPHSIHLRLTDDQFKFCSDLANALGVGVADFIRMTMNSVMVTSEKAKHIQLGDLGKYEDNENNQQYLV